MAPLLKPTHSGHLPLLFPSAWGTLLSAQLPRLLFPGACDHRALWPELLPDPGPRLESMVVCASSTHLDEDKAGLLPSVWVSSAAPISSAHSWPAPHTLQYFLGPAQPWVRTAVVRMHWAAERGPGDSAGPIRSSVS